MPEGIGYASLAGLDPMLGIYAGMGSVLMMSTLTSAIALTMAGILGDSGYTADQIPQAVFTLTLLAGLTGVSDASRATLARTGLLPPIGEANVLPLVPTLGGELESGFGRGRELWSELGPRGASSGRLTLVRAIPPMPVRARHARRSPLRCG